MSVIEKLPPVFDTKTLADALDTTTRHLVDLRQRREGAPFFRIGRKVRYDREAVKAWLAANAMCPAA
jgi:hypothetical protein